MKILILGGYGVLGRRLAALGKSRFEFSLKLSGKWINHSGMFRDGELR